VNGIDRQPEALQCVSAEDGEIARLTEERRGCARSGLRG
jgi:hypothetical protein